MSSDAGPGTRAPERIFLIGYRATGKTSLGRALAGRLGYDFQDTDSLLEERLGMSFARYFETRGEDAFRQQEAEVLQGVAAPGGIGEEPRKGLVIATGGGIVLSEENVARMRAAGRVVWLTASTDTIRKRLREDAATSSRRPALEGASAVDEVEQVLEERSPLYRAAAHLSMSTEDGGPESLAEELAERLAASSGAPGAGPR